MDDVAAVSTTPESQYFPDDDDYSNESFLEELQHVENRLISAQQADGDLPTSSSSVPVHSPVANFNSTYAQDKKAPYPTAYTALFESVNIKQTDENDYVKIYCTLSYVFKNLARTNENIFVHPVQTNGYIAAQLLQTLLSIILLKDTFKFVQYMVIHNGRIMEQNLFNGSKKQVNGKIKEQSNVQSLSCQHLYKPSVFALLTVLQKQQIFNVLI
ncbi:hypothetical protein C8J55DRAFT_491433 [Lentinula edodes]|uniref:Uncharacterized protein n=1 Tax=Lentinula lateritia TaxID=40482 RepID=A0A9W9A052_9AGAR|nr:hypothetical protein C8J55DRAFT_491433 [Lentinula edodes]